MTREQIVKALADVKGDNACACRPDELVQCLLHFDLDAHILRKAITEEREK